jgi:pimeloyl-ACP methyl ester carboxylesterase
MRGSDSGTAVQAAAQCGMRLPRGPDWCTAFHCVVVQGLSGRPAFNASDQASAEDFFLESLNAWRVKQGIKEKFILVGHSLGEGCATTSRRSGRVNQLQFILVGHSLGECCATFSRRSGCVNQLQRFG